MGDHRAQPGILQTHQGLVGAGGERAAAKFDEDPLAPAVGGDQPMTVALGHVGVDAYLPPHLQFQRDPLGTQKLPRRIEGPLDLGPDVFEGTVVMVGGADQGSGPLRDGDAGHFEKGWNIFGAVVDAGENVTVDVDQRGAALGLNKLGDVSGAAAHHLGG